MKVRSHSVWLLAILAGTALYAWRAEPVDASAPIAQRTSLDTQENYLLLSRLLKSPQAFLVTAACGPGQTFTFVGEYRTSQYPRYVVSRGSITGETNIVEVGTLTLYEQESLYAELALVPEVGKDAPDLKVIEHHYTFRRPGGPTVAFYSSLAKTDNRARALLQRLDETFVGRRFVKHGWAGTFL